MIYLKRINHELLKELVNNSTITTFDYPKKKKNDEQIKSEVHDLVNLQLQSLSIINAPISNN